MALLGCLLGNLLAACGFVADHQSISVAQVVSQLNPEMAVALLSATLSPMDLLFYGFALYAGYSYSARRIAPHEIVALMSNQPTNPNAQR